MMKNKTIEKIRNWRYLSMVIGMLIIAVPRIITAFSIVWFGDSKIPVFSFDRMVRVSIFQRMDAFNARVLGNHVRETEYGEIRLGHGSLVGVTYTLLDSIEVESFKNGNASHNLVVDEIVMPENIWIAFRGSRIALLALDGQEIIVSGIPFVVTNFSIKHLRQNTDIEMIISGKPEYVTLNDNTQVRFNPRGGHGSLSIYNNEELWKLENQFYALEVTSPGETEFTRYKSITFKPHWGEFIEGELWSGR